MEKSCFLSLLQCKFNTASYYNTVVSVFQSLSCTLLILARLLSRSITPLLNLNESLRRSSCVFDLWKPDEREREKSTRATSSQMINLIKQSSHGSTSLSKQMTWKNLFRVSQTADRLKLSRTNLRNPEETQCWNSPLCPRAPSVTLSLAPSVSRSLGGVSLFCLSRLSSCLTAEFAHGFSLRCRGLMQVNQANAAAYGGALQSRLLYLLATVWAVNMCSPIINNTCHYEQTDSDADAKIKPEPVNEEKCVWFL